MPRLRRYMLLVYMAIVSCKTPDGELELDGESLSTEGSEEGGEDPYQTIPLTLWSPEQRQSSAGYYFLVGELMTLRGGDKTRSLKILEASYNLDPNPFLGGKVIAAQAANGDREAATLAARKMVLMYPKDTNLRFLYGQLLALMGQHREAEVQLERCISLDPTHEAAYSELIDLYQRNRDTTKALVVVKELTKNVPHSLIGWTQLSRLYLSRGSYKEALEPARRAWEMQSTNPQLTQVYGLVLQLNGMTKQAIRVYERLYQLNPADNGLLARMVDLYRELGNLEDALELLDEILSNTDGEKPGIYMQKALLLWELKRYQQASQLLARLATKYPESEEIRYMSAIGKEYEEDYETALKAYRSIRKGSKYHYPALGRQTIVAKKQKRLDDARELAIAMTKHENVEWDAYAILAGILSDLKEYDEAVEATQEGYQKYPDRPRLLFLTGVYQEKAGDFEDCIKTMRLVIEKDPTNSSAYNYLGYLFAERGENLEEAERLVKKALELKPNDGFYLDSLGWVYFQMGHYDKARKPLELASEREPKEGVIHEHLGDLEKALGKKDRAKQLYQKALTLNLEDKDRKRIEAKLQELAGN